MAAAVALVVEVLALAPMTVVSVAERLEELVEPVALVEAVLRLVVSFESEAVSAAQRIAELRLLVDQRIPELDVVHHQCLSRRHLGPHHGPRPRCQSRPYHGPPLLLVRTPAEVRSWTPG